MHRGDEVGGATQRVTEHRVPAGGVLYTAGYAGRTPAGLVRLVDALGVVVVDVRAFPASRVRHWRGDALAALLGARYAWRGDVLGGCVRGRPGPTAEGLARLGADLDAGARFLLLCAERAPGDCHRWGLITRGRFPEALHLYHDGVTEHVLPEPVLARAVRDGTYDPSADSHVLRVPVGSARAR